MGTLICNGIFLFSPLLLSGTAGKEGVLIYRRLLGRWMDGYHNNTMVMMVVEPL